MGKEVLPSKTNSNYKEGVSDQLNNNLDSA